jgi:hypothetical protein
MRHILTLMLALAALATAAAGPPVEGDQAPIPIVFNAPEDGGGDPAMDPPPEPAPLAGQFLFAGVENLFAGDENPTGPETGVNVFSYLRLPEAAPVDGRVDAWILLMFSPSQSPIPGKPVFWMMQQTFDCSAKQIRPGGVQMYVDPNQRVTWVRPMNEGWLAVDTGAMAKALDLACGTGKPDTPVLTDVAAARADATKRFAVP